jgi:hypothetical protein
MNDEEKTVFLSSFISPFDTERASVPKSDVMSSEVLIPPKQTGIQLAYEFQTNSDAGVHHGDAPVSLASIMAFLVEEPDESTHPAPVHADPTEAGSVRS